MDVLLPDTHTLITNTHTYYKQHTHLLQTHTLITNTHTRLLQDFNILVVYLFIYKICCIDR